MKYICRYKVINYKKCLCKQGFGDVDYDYSDETDIDNVSPVTVPAPVPGIQSKFTVKAIKRPPGSGLGGPEDFGETNAVVSILSLKVKKLDWAERHYFDHEFGCSFPLFS